MTSQTSRLAAHYEIMGVRSVMAWFHTKAISSKPDPLAAWGMQLEGEFLTSTAKKAVSCVSACSPPSFGHSLWAKPSVSASREALCIQDAVAAPEFSWIAAVLCAKPLCKPSLLNIIFKCHVLSRGMHLMAAHILFWQTFITPFPLPLPRPFPHFFICKNNYARDQLS